MDKSSSPGARTSLALLAWDFVDQRLGLSDVIAIARHKTVPEHSQSFWYYWGGISMFFFVVQVITGILLLVYYRPGPEAYDSVRQITYDVDFGWLVRSTHAWSANLMVLAVFVHMFSVYFMKAYRNPREFGWWSGLALLGATLVFGFSGYLLPSDELSFFATKVGLEIPASVPWIGPALADLVRGGPDVNDNTIQRFFALHVVVLPAVFAAILAFHLYLVQRHGNASPPSEEAKPAEKRKSIPFFPDFMVKDLAMWLIALNVLGILACMVPLALGPQADPLAPAPAGIHPEWYFMSQFQALKVLGQWIPGTAGEIVGILAFGLAGLVWALVPLADTGSGRPRMAKAGTWIGVAALAGLVILTVWGYLAI